MDVSIIIVNYNTSKLINDCIDSIFDKVKDIEYEIVIVDNNTENLKSMIVSSGDPRVKLLQLPENVGFGRANNEGAKIAQGRNLFLLNPDTLLLNNAVKILSDYLDANPDCGGCGGNLFDENLKPRHSYQIIMPGFIDSLDLFSNRKITRLFYRGNNEFNNTDEPLRVGYITGADLMIPKNVFVEVNGFDPSFFMYYEETDLCKRISNAGMRIVSVPQSKIIHLVGMSNPDGKKKIFKPFTFECYAQSRKIYYNKHLNMVNRWSARLVNRLHFSFRVFRAIIRGNEYNKAVFKVFMKNS